MRYLLLFVIFVQLSVYDFFPGGAPLERCGSMMPGHNVAPIKEPAPFAISVARAHHEKDLKLFVSLHAKDQTTHFKGFLLEARGRWDGQSFGLWSTDVKHTKALDCFDLPQSALTHHYSDDAELVKNSGFNNITFLWTPPENKKLNRVKFM